MSSAKSLFRRLLTQPLRRSSVGAKSSALRVEALEDRTTPAVTAVVPPSTTDLQVTLDAANDTATLSLNGANIEVRDQANTLIASVPANTVTDFDITGTNAGNQTVNLNSSFTLTGAVNIGLGGSTRWVTDVNFNAPETAGLVNINATNNVTVRSITTTGAVLPGPVTDGGVTLIADVDGGGNGTFTLNTNASINTTGSASPTPSTPGYQVTAGGAGITFSAGSNVTAGTAGVAVDSSASNFVYSAPATNVVTNTSGTFQVNSYDPAPRVWAADTTAASFTGSYVLFIQRAASLTLDGINTSAGGNNIQINVGDHSVSAGGDLTIGGAIDAGTGTVYLSADNAGIGDPGPSTVTGSHVTLAAYTAMGSLALPVVTATSQLTAVSQTGGIWISNTGDVRLTNDVRVSGAGILAAGNGDVSLVNSGSVVVSNGAGVSTASGNVTLTAGTGVADTFGYEPGAGGTISSGGGAITVNANNMVIAGAIAAGAGAVTLNAGTSNAGGTVTVGTASAAAAITGATVSINGGAGADTFNLTNATGSALTVDGRGPATDPGDELALPSGGGSNAVGTPGTGTVTGATNLPTVTYTGVESFASATAAPTALVVSTTSLGVGGNGGPDTVRLVRTGSRLEVRSGGTLYASVDYASAGAITVSGSSDDDALVVDNGGGLIGRTVTYSGGGGADNALVVQGNAGGGVSATYTTSTAGPAHSGSLAYTDGTSTEAINFSGLSPVESLTPVTSLTVNDGSNSAAVTVGTGPTSSGIDPLLGTAAATYQVNFASPAAEAISWRNAAAVAVNGSAGSDTVTVNLQARVDAAAGAFALTTLNVTPGGGADEVDVLATPAGVTTNVDTQVGVPDQTVIGGTLAAFNTGAGTLANVLGPVTVTDSGGVGQLYVDDSGAAAGVTATLTATTIVVGATPAITYDANMTVVQLALTAFGDTVNVQSTQSGGASSNTTVTTIFARGGNDTINVSSSAPAPTGNLGGIQGELDVNTGTGVDALNVSDLGGSANNSYDLSAGGGRTTLSESAGAFADIVYDADGTAGQLENFDLTGSSAGGNDYNVNATTATVSTTVSDGSAAASGDSTFGIGGSNLSGQTTFQGFGGVDSFRLNVNTSIGQNAVAGGPVAGVTIDGGLGVGGTANDSNHRDQVTVADNSPAARGLNFQYLATPGGLDVQAASSGSGLFGANGGGTLPLRIRGAETLVHTHAANNDVVTVAGTAGNDVLTVGLLQNNTSAAVFLNGTPYLNAAPATVQGSLPGVAGGGTGPDLLIGGLSPAAGLTLSGGGVPANGGDRAVVYAASELPLSVAGGTVDYFGFGAGNLLPGFGTGTAVDTIDATDSAVTTTNNAVGALTTVHLDTASFIQTTPVGTTQQPALVVDGGDEAGPQGDVITATVSGNYNIRVNGNLPAPAGGTDRLTINAGGTVTVFSDTSSPPTVVVTSGGAFGIGYSSIEDVSISAATVNVLGDDNNTTPQADTFSVTGTAQNAFALAINGSPPIRFSGVDTLAVSGGQADDSATITPFATAGTPWGVAATVDGGGSGGANGDTLTYLPAPGITNQTHLVVTGPRTGHVDADGIGAAATDRVLGFSNVDTVNVGDGLNAGGFGDTLAIDLATGAATDDVTFAFPTVPTLTNPQIALASGGAPLLGVNTDFGHLPALTVTGGTGTANYTVDLAPSTTALPVALTVTGGTGPNNTLTLVGVAGGPNTFANTAGGDPTSGTAALGGATSATVAYAGLQQTNFVGGGGTAADALNLSGAGTLSVTGTGAGAGTAAVTGQSAITFRNFGTASAINLAGTGGPDVFAISQPVGWGIPTVTAAETPASAAATLQLVATTNSDTIAYDPGAGTVAVDDGSGAAGRTTYTATGITRFSVDGNTPVAPALPGDTLTVASFLPGAATLPAGTLGTTPQISYQNIETVLVGALPVAADDGPFDVNAGTPVPLDVAANDAANAGSTPLTLIVVAPPAHGTVTVDNASSPRPTVVYTPDTNYFGADSFTYNLVDGNGQVSATAATVALNVLAVAHAPTAAATSPVSAPEASAVPVAIAGALSPSANTAETLTYTVSGVPAGVTFNHGADAGGGVWTFTPADLAGLTITAPDGPATLTLTVTATSTVTGLPPAQVGTPAAASGTAPLVVTVADVAPTATLTITGPFVPGQPDTLTFSNPADASPADAAAGFTYQYDLGTGTFGPATASPTATFVPPAAGTYTVRGKVIDKDGGFTVYTATSPGAPAGETVVANVDVYAVGAGPGGGPEVRVYSAATNTLVASFFAYDPAFRGGVSVAVADLTGDGIPDVVTGAGVGGGPEVRVFDGVTFAPVASFFAYDPSFRGGVHVAAGELDGRAVIATGAGVGGGPHVEVFDGRSLAPVASFFAYDPASRDGVSVAVADVLGTGAGEIVTGAGAGGGPNVRVFTGGGALLQSFFAYDPAFRGGVSVSGGDLYGNGYADIVTGPGAGGGADLRVFDGRTGTLVASAAAFGPDRRTGRPLRDGFAVSATHAGGATGKPVVVVASGAGYAPTVRVFDAALADPTAVLAPFDDTFTGGVFVG